MSGSSLAGNKTTGQALLEDTESVLARGNAKDLQSEGSPQLPDLVPSKSPQFKQERKGSLSSKHKSGAPKPSSTPATDIPPPYSAKLLEAPIVEKAPGCIEHLSGTTKHGADRRDESSSGSAGIDTPTGDSPHGKNTEVLATPTLAERQNSRDTVPLPGLDGILNRCALSLVGMHEVQSETNKEVSQGIAHASRTGTAGTSNLNHSTDKGYPHNPAEFVLVLKLFFKSA